MKMIKRDIESIVFGLSSQFPVLLVTGARQVGKTTLLKSIASADREFVSFDDPALRAFARNDPKMFFQIHRPPLLLDEIQYVPELFAEIKIYVDEHRDQSGLFWLTGSQPFRLMKGIVETLAGRVALLPLGGIGQAEELKREAGTFAVDDELLRSGPFETAPEIFERIFRGAFPDLVSHRVKNWGVFYRSYVQTYLERDIRDLIRITDESKFLEFLRVMAARTGQLLNLSNMARDVGISSVTAKAWLSLVETSGLVFLLRPYSRNVTARIVKTPKLYFLDTGLACYLAGWNDAKSLMDGSMAGAMLETFAVSELVKRAWNVGEEPRLWFYREAAGAEIDILLERNGCLHPLEVKKTANPTLADVRCWSAVRAKGLDLGVGGILCCVQKAYPIAEKVFAIGIGSL